MKQSHIICLLVKDEPGVMNRITGLITRRNFNIETITVGKTNLDGVSKIVLTMFADAKTLEQVKKQLGKIIEIVKITEMPAEKSIVRELCLIKVAVKNQEARNEITSYVKMFRTKIVDVTPKSLVLQIAGKPQQIDAFLDLMKKFGIIETSRTGVTAIARGQKNSGNSGD